MNIKLIFNIITLITIMLKRALNELQHENNSAGIKVSITHHCDISRLARQIPESTQQHGKSKSKMKNFVSDGYSQIKLKEMWFICI